MVEVDGYQRRYQPLYSLHDKTGITGKG